MDAAEEASIYIGQIVTSDGGSHTIDTTGSSKMEWRTGNCTFANAGTTVKVGLATVDTGAGPPGRATAVANVITFSVSKSHTGGGGGITANAWQSNVPDTGTMTIANGDLVAFCVQMTARGGVDAIRSQAATNSSNQHLPGVTAYSDGAYTSVSQVPNCFITFSDGATGHFFGGEVVPGEAGVSPVQARTWNSGSATKEYGQLYNFPFPMKIHGLYGWADPDANFDMVLYSDPLGTPVAEKTVSFDANVSQIAVGRFMQVMFPAAYSYTAGTNIAVAFKPGASNISAFYKTFGAAGHRVTDVYGTSGYGVSRATGAFADANSSLDNYYIGLIASAFSDGTAPITSTAPLFGGGVI